METNHESLSGSIELTALTGSQIQTAQDGQLVYILPLGSVSDVELYTDRQGQQRVYLNLNIWKKRNNVDANGLDVYGYSHDIQQNYSQAKRMAMPQGVYPPSIGRAKPIARKNPVANNVPNVYAQPAPQGYTAVNPVPNAYAPQAPVPAPQAPRTDSDPLPF